MRKNVLTEKELMEAQKIQTYFLDARSNTFANDLETLEELLPSMYHLNSKEDGSVVHVNDQFSEQIDLSVEEVNELGVGFIENYLHPDAQAMTPFLLNFYQNGDESDVLTFFQQVRRTPKHDFNWFFTTTKVYRRRNALISITSPVDQLHKIGYKMNRMLGEYHFMKTNFKKYDSLTRMEKKILAHVARGETNPQIADVLFISQHTVKNHRKAIKKKLEAKTLADLIKFARAFELG